MVKRAMKPVCHVDVTDNVALAVAALATGVMASPRMATINASVKRCPPAPHVNVQSGHDSQH